MQLTMQLPCRDLSPVGLRAPPCSLACSPRSPSIDKGYDLLAVKRLSPPTTLSRHGCISNDLDRSISSLSTAAPSTFVDDCDALTSRPCRVKVVHNVLGALCPEAALRAASLAALLDEDRWQLWLRAALALTRQAPDGEALAELETWLFEPAWALRAMASWTLGGVGAQLAPRSLTQVAESLRDDEASVRVASAWLVGRLAPSTDSFVEQLVACLSDVSVQVREAAVGALRNMGPDAVDPVAKALAHEDWSVRRAAAQVLRDLSPLAASHVQQLIRCLRDPFPSVQEEAASALGNHGSEAAEMVASFLDEVDNVSAWQFAARALGDMGELAEPYVPTLTTLLCDSFSSTREAAAQALVHIGLRSVPDLVRLLQDPTRSVTTKEVALRAVGRIGSCAATHAADVAALLTDKEATIRATAAQTLSRLDGEHAALYAQVLASLLDDDEPLVRAAAVASLGALPDAGVSPYAARLAGLLNDSDASVVRALLRVLTDMGAQASQCDRRAQLPSVLSTEVAPFAVITLRARSVAARCAAAEALGSLGALAAPHSSALVARLSDESKLVRRSAAAALGRVGSRAVGQIAMLLKSRRKDAQEAALWSLAALGEDAASHASNVAACLHDPSSSIREAAALALRSIGQAAAAHVSLLMRSGAADWGTKRLASQVLRRIGGDAGRQS